MGAVNRPPKVTLLAGGVGGAKLAEGLAALDDVDLSIIGNIGDDDTFHGLWVSPDIDTLTYSLAGIINRDQGWGVADEGLRALDTLRVLGQDCWMTLGDRDFGLHIYRTMRRLAGDRPSDIAASVARAFGLTCRILLPTDDAVPTRVRTAAGWLSFQEYFVRERCRPEVLGLDFADAAAASPTPEALAALEAADLIVIAPSNPLASIAPILAIAGLTQAIKRSAARKIAICPLIGGTAVKGPTVAMMASLGHRPDAIGIAAFYRDVVDTLVIDDRDAALAGAIEAMGLAAPATNILMREHADKVRLSREVIQLALVGAAEVTA